MPRSNRAAVAPVAETPRARYGVAAFARHALVGVACLGAWLVDPPTADADPPTQPTTGRTEAARPVAGHGMPQACEQDPFHVNYGPIQEGSLVRLGRHRSVEGNANWDPSMEHYVGRVTNVVAARGLDPQGCPIVEVAVDGGEYVWRVRDLVVVADAPADAAPPIPEVRLVLGHVPDPQVYEAEFQRTSRRANSLKDGCSGWIASQPTLTLVLEDDFPTLSILTRSAVDAVLLVRTPGGEVVCVDDVDGRDPLLSGRAQAGRYEVFVGTYEPGDVDARFRLALSERGTIRASALDAIEATSVRPLRREADTRRPTRLQPGRARSAPTPSPRPSEGGDAAEPSSRSANTR